MHNQNVNVVRASVRQGVAVAVDEASPYLVARSDPTGALSLRDFDRALARIPAEQRRVILLIGLEGITYEEAAAILDVPIGTIRSRLSRGRESLRKLIDWIDWRDDVEATNGEAITSAKPNHRQFVSEVTRAKNSDFLPV
jgi:RNA polymerase sigma-70 factor (ECF subfamily)